MATDYLPEWATAREAADWLQAATGEPWPLPRLLETSLLPHVWLAPDKVSPSVLSAAFDGRQEGFLAPLVFAGDTQRLSVERAGAMSMTRSPAGKLLQFTPPIPFTADELRFAALEVRETAAILGGTPARTEGLSRSLGFEVRPAPDWPHWRLLGEVRLFEAVYLMLNIEPPNHPPDEDKEPEGYAKALRALSQAMRDRMQFSPCALNMSRPALCSVRLDEVGAWAARIGRAIPGEFPKADSASVSGIGWPLWLALPSVALWQGIALVLGVNPERLRRSPDEWMAGPGRGPVFIRESFPNPRKADEFERAMSFAVQATNHSGPIRITGGLASGMNKRTAQVALADVVRFFALAGWSGIPEELDSLSAPHSSTLQPAQPSAEAAGSARGSDGQSWRELAGAFMARKLREGRFSTAKAMEAHLRASVNDPDSPFEEGVGVNRGHLVLRATGKRLELKTLQNAWQELRRLAGLK